MATAPPTDVPTPRGRPPVLPSGRRPQPAPTAVPWVVRALPVLRALLRRARRALPVVLSLLVVIGLLGAASGLTLLLVSRSTEGVRTALEQDRQATAVAVAGGMSTWFATARGQAASVAAALPDAAGDPLALAARVRVLAPAATSFDAGLFVVGLDGRILAAAGDQQVHVGRHTTPPAPQVLSGETTVTSVVREGRQGVLVVTAQAPLTDVNGSVTGAVVGATTVPALTQVLARTAQVGDLAVALLGPDDVVLRPGGTRPEPLSTRPGFPPAESRGVPRLARYDGEGGVPMLAAVAPVSNGWSVLVAGEAAATDAVGRLPVAAALPGVVAVALLGLTGIVLADARARRAARRMNASRRAMLAVVGHELRTPLTVILGYTQMLTTRWDRLPEDKRREQVTTVARQSRTLDRLIERLLHAGQLGELTKTIAPKTVDLSAVVLEVVAVFSAEAPLHTFVLQVDDEVQVRADRQALVRVLSHLVENAVKYSPAGGAVTIAARTGSRYVQVVVDDEGVGLPADTTRIFDEFTQGQDVDTRGEDEGGVGLGLHIVRTLTEAMGGGVRAERRRAGGARFVVSLPAPPDDSGPPQDAPK